MLDLATEIRKGEELDKEKLQAFLQNQNVGLNQINNILQFSGGYSNLTYELVTNAGSFVLRKPPKGAEHIKGGHNMKREHDLLKLVYESGFKNVPKMILYCDNNDILGSEFYIMEKLNGTIFRVAAIDSQKEILKPDLCNALSIKIAEALANLHKIDIQSTGLINLGKPEGYISRQVEGWFKRYKASETDKIKEIESVYTWLVENMPEEIKPSLIHNDYKYDNLIFDLESKEILALLDWEMSTVGDPRMDIGTALSYWCEAVDEDFEKQFNITWLPGNISREQFIVEYKKHYNIDLNDILYFYIFGLFKNAVVLQQIYNRYKKGLTKDSRFKGLIFGVMRLSKKAQLSITNSKMC